MTSKRINQTSTKEQEKIAKRKSDRQIVESIGTEFRRFIASSSLIKDETFFHILHSKMQGKSARAFFVVYLSQYVREVNSISEKKYKKYTVFLKKHLPFILEAIISIQYYHNQILDGKAGVITPAAINDNLIKGNLLKDELYSYIENLKLSYKDKSRLMCIIRSIFEQVDIGQYIEKHHNTYEAYLSNQINHPFTSFLQGAIEADEALVEILETIEKVIRENASIPEEKIPFLRLYLRRIYLTNTSLYKLTTELITDFLKTPSEIREEIIKFAVLFGMIHQLVNDNVDFIPSYYGQATKSKTPFDAFSDLKNKNITLPTLIHLMRNPQGKIAYFLNSTSPQSIDRKCLYRETQKEFFNEIKESSAICDAIHIAKSLKKIAITLLKNVDDTINDFTEMLQIAENNRYYDCFYKNAFCTKYSKKLHSQPTVAALV